jgi:DNA-binding MarR family transcriptional regulator
MIDLANNLVRHIGTLSRSMIRALDIEMAPLGMGSGRFSYLFMLYISEGVTQQEMAVRLQADKAAVARTLAQLEEQGYVRRDSDPRDGRVTRVFLTDKSRALRGHLEDAVARVIAQLQATLDATQQAVIRDILQRMAESLAAGYEGINGNINANANANSGRKDSESPRGRGD